MSNRSVIGFLLVLNQGTRAGQVCLHEPSPMQRSRLTATAPVLPIWKLGQAKRSTHSWFRAQASWSTRTWRALPSRTRLAPGLAGQLEHAGMPRDDHLEAGLLQSLPHHLRQLGLPVGVYLADVPDAEAFQRRPYGQLGRLAVEVPAGAGMVLVAGHRGGAVFHHDEE